MKAKYTAKQPKIKVEIAKKGKTQQEIATSCKVSETYMSRVINGYAHPGAKLAAEIAGILGVRVQEIFSLEV